MAVAAAHGALRRDLLPRLHHGLSLTIPPAVIPSSRRSNPPRFPSGGGGRGGPERGNSSALGPGCELTSLEARGGISLNVNTTRALPSTREHASVDACVITHTSGPPGRGGVHINLMTVLSSHSSGGRCVGIKGDETFPPLRFYSITVSCVISVTAALPSQLFYFFCI